MTPYWLDTPAWTALVKALLHSLWQGTLVAVLLGLLLRNLAHPIARYRCAVGALAALLFCGLLTWAVLGLPKPQPIATSPPAIAAGAAPVSTGVQSDLPPVVMTVPLGKPDEAPVRWTAWLALLWVVGAGMMLSRAVFQVAGAERLRRASRPLEDPQFDGLLAEARQLVGLTRRVRLGVTDKLTSPAVVGALAPTLILPLSLVSTLSPQQVRFILLHELAHIRRGDYFANLFQLFAEALLFFNPAVWWISRQVRLEREACCDALAVELSGAPAEYARTLVHVVENVLSPSAAATALGDRREPSSLSDRLQRMLVPGYRPALRLTWRAMGLALLAGSVLLVLSAVGTRSTIAAILSPQKAELSETNSAAMNRLPSAEIIARAKENAKRVMEAVNFPPDTTVPFSGSLVAYGGPHPDHEIFALPNSPLTDPNYQANYQAWQRSMGVEIGPGVMPVSYATLPGSTSAQADTLVEWQNPSASVSVGTNTPDMLLSATIFEMPTAGFDSRVAWLDDRSYRSDTNVWHIARPHTNLFPPPPSEATILGSPHIQAPAGVPAQIYIGDGTNGLSMDFVAVIDNDLVNLKLHGQLVRADRDGTLFTNKFASEAATPNDGSLVVRFPKTERNSAKTLATVIKVTVLSSGGRHLPNEDRRPPNGNGASNRSTNHFVAPLPVRKQDTPVWTGPGRHAIMAKLDKIHLDSVSYDHLPLGEALKQLSQQVRQRDPERKGINFLINDPKFSGPPAQEPNLDSTTGILAAPPSAQDEVASYIINIPNLVDVTLGQLLDAIVLVSDHPLKYSVQDFAIIFSARDPQLFTRTFKVDPNTFFSGLENVGATTFGGAQNGGGGANSQGQNNGAVVGRVNAFPGAGNVGGTGRSPQGGVNTMENSGASSGATTTAPQSTPGVSPREFIKTLGVDLENPPGKAIFYKDRLGYLYVKATKEDLDIIEKGMQKINHQTPPPNEHNVPHAAGSPMQTHTSEPIHLHLKAVFFEVSKEKFSGFAKYFTLTNSEGGQPYGILTRGQANSLLQEIKAAQARVLSESEITFLSGRRAQLRATDLVTVVTNLVLAESNGVNSVLPQACTMEFGPVLDATASLMNDSRHTITLNVTPSLDEFLGYEQLQLPQAAGDPVQVPQISPKIRVQKTSAKANLWDGQTIILGGLKKRQQMPQTQSTPAEGGVPLLGRLFQMRGPVDDDILTLITVSLVDEKDAPIHKEDDLRFAQDDIPPQPSESR